MLRGSLFCAVSSRAQRSALWIREWTKLNAFCLCVCIFLCQCSGRDYVYCLRRNHITVLFTKYPNWILWTLSSNISINNLWGPNVCNNDTEQCRIQLLQMQTGAPNRYTFPLITCSKLPVQCVTISFILIDFPETLLHAD